MNLIMLIMLSFGGNYTEYQHFGDELTVIRAAAERNGIVYGSDNWYLLLAIRKAENGSLGNEFGIKCPKHINTDLDGQAACAAVTVVNCRKRWETAGKPGSFMKAIAGRYCPRSADPTGYINWISNVSHWKDRLQNGL